MKKRNTAAKLTAAALTACMLAGSTASAVPVEVKAAETGESQWEAIQSVISRYYGEWDNANGGGAVSDQLPDTALLGNGDVGVTSELSDTEKTFYISKGDFWNYEGAPLTVGGVTIGAQQNTSEEDGTNIAPDHIRVEVSSRDINPDFDPEDALSGNAEQNPNGYGWVSSCPAWGDQAEGDFWMEVEFAEPVTVARWAVKWDGYVRSGYDVNNPKDFSLQISEDGTTWEDVDVVTGNTENTTDRNLASPVTSKYFRLHLTAPQQNNDSYTRARVGQLEFYPEAKEIVSDNLALNKPVKVCSEFTDQGVTHQGAYIVDGNNSTKWCSLHDDESTHWAIVDLGEMKDIAYYSLTHSGIVGETQHNTVDYQLQYLDSAEEDWDTIENTDESLWKDMDVVTGNTQTVTSKTFETPIQARYIRLLITNPAPSNKAARIHELELKSEAPISFHEKQDILNAEIQTEQGLAGIPAEMKTWISADKNIMVTELTSNGTEDVQLYAEAWASQQDTAKKPITAQNDENTVTVTRSSETKESNRTEAHISKTALSTKVIGADVTASSDNENGTGTLEFTLEAGETVYVVTAIGGGGRTYHTDGSLWECDKEPEADAAELLASVGDENAVSELNQARQEWWKDYWSASYIDFGTADENLNKVQKYYYGAQYLLGSSTREGEVAPGIYALWHTTDNGWWNSDYHLNYNFMSAFYGTNTSNRSELSLPGIEALLGFMTEGQERATSVDELKRINADFVEQKIAKGDIDAENGIEGAILYPVGIGPWGMTLDNAYHNEALNAAYNSYLMTQYYDYTLDEEILTNGVYDYLKQSVAFYEAWLEKEDSTENEDGYEYVLYAGYNEGSWAINPAVELAALKNALDHLITYSEQLGLDEEKRADWIDIRDHLSEQPTTTVNGKTVLALAEKEWKNNQWVDLASPIPADGNAIPLDAMLPGQLYNYFSSPEDLQMVRDTIDVFSNNGAWSQANNFPRLFTEAVKSRYDINTIVTKLVDVINRQMQANLRIKDGMHGIEKSGATEAINSMMLITEEGITKIFPNWYADKDAKFANLRAKGAFTVSAEYDGTAQEAKNVTITSEEGSDMTLVVPWAEGATVKDSEGNIVKTEAGTVPNYPDEKTITFSTTAGETYTVEKGEAEKPSKNTLEYFLNKAKEHQANGDVDDCVESIKNLFAEAIAEGEAVMADENATYDEVMDATVKLMKAIQALDMKAADKTDLEMAVELAQSIDLTKYVEEGQVEFQQALAAAQEVLADGDAMQADADTAWNALVDAISNLRLKADKSTLEDLLNSVADLDLSQYTEESAAVFRTALANAQAVLADETLSEDDQKTVDEAVQALSDAKDQLQPKDASTGDGNDNTGDGSDNAGNGDGNTGNGDSQTPGNGDDSGNNGNSGNNNTGNSAGNSNAKAAKTGDAAMPFAMLALAAAAGTVAVVSVRKKQTR